MSSSETTKDMKMAGANERKRTERDFANTNEVEECAAKRQKVAHKTTNWLLRQSAAPSTRRKDAHFSISRPKFHQPIPSLADAVSKLMEQTPDQLLAATAPIPSLSPLIVGMATTDPASAPFAPDFDTSNSPVRELAKAQRDGEQQEQDATASVTQPPVNEDEVVDEGDEDDSNVFGDYDDFFRADPAREETIPVSEDNILEQILQNEEDAAAVQAEQTPADDLPTLPASQAPAWEIETQELQQLEDGNDEDDPVIDITQSFDRVGANPDPAFATSMRDQEFLSSTPRRARSERMVPPQLRASSDPVPALPSNVETVGAAQNPTSLAPTAPTAEHSPPEESLAGVDSFTLEGRLPPSRFAAPPGHAGSGTTLVFQATMDGLTDDEQTLQQREFLAARLVPPVGRQRSDLPPNPDVQLPAPRASPPTPSVIRRSRQTRTQQLPPSRSPPPSPTARPRRRNLPWGVEVPAQATQAPQEIQPAYPLPPTRSPSVSPEPGRYYPPYNPVVPPPRGPSRSDRQPPGTKTKATGPEVPDNEYASGNNKFSLRMQAELAKPNPRRPNRAPTGIWPQTPEYVARQLDTNMRLNQMRGEGWIAKSTGKVDKKRKAGHDDAVDGTEDILPPLKKRKAKHDDAVDGTEKLPPPSKKRKAEDDDAVDETESLPPPSKKRKPAAEFAEANEEVRPYMADYAAGHAWAGRAWAGRPPPSVRRQADARTTFRDLAQNNPLSAPAPAPAPPLPRRIRPTVPLDIYRPRAPLPPDSPYLLKNMTPKPDEDWLVPAINFARYRFPFSGVPLTLEDVPRILLLLDAERVDFELLDFGPLA